MHALACAFKCALIRTTLANLVAFIVDVSAQYVPMCICVPLCLQMRAEGFVGGAGALCASATLFPSLYVLPIPHAFQAVLPPLRPYQSSYATHPIHLPSYPASHPPIQGLRPNAHASCSCCATHPPRLV